MLNKKQIRYLTSILALIVMLTPSLVFAQEGSEPVMPEYSETIQGLPICAPGVYLTDPHDCLPYGPSAILTDWARKGLTLPPKPAPGAHPNSSYNEIDQKYAKLNISFEEQATFYPNIDSAAIGQGGLRSLPSGDNLYITYASASYIDGRPYLQTHKGEWIRASPLVVSNFQGLVFKVPPASDFGWIVDLATPRIQPDINSATIGEPLNRESVVNVYDKLEAQGTTWYMIGMNQWVDRTKIRVLSPKSEAPEGVDNGRWIEINLEEQVLSVYENNQLIFATLIATGYEPYYTQPGLFQIYEKLDFETMQGSFSAGKTDFYYLENVPWTLYYDGPRAIHGAYWRTYFGYEQSHGCVNLSIGDSRWVYEWAEVGDYVYVHDPSGRTPTDPEFYKEGVPAF